MNKERKTSINIAISILKDLMEGKHITIGNDIIAMSDEGHVGYMWKKQKEDMVTDDLTIRKLAELVEKYEIIPIPDVR